MSTDEFDAVFGADKSNESGGVFYLADRVIELRNLKRAADDKAAAIGSDLARVEQQLVERMVSEDSPNFTRKGNQFVVTTTNYVSTRKEAGPALQQWLRDNGYDSLIGETVHPSTLRGFVNELLNDGPLPDELAQHLNVFSKPGIRITAR